MIVYTTGETAPFSFRDEKSNPCGFDIDLAHLIAKEIDRDIEIRCVPFDDMLKKIQSKQGDIAIAAISITDERKNLVDFSPPYHSNGFVLLMLNGTPEKVEDLNQSNRKIGVRKGTYQEGTAKLQWVNIPNIFVNSFDNLTSEDISNKLRSGEVAAFILDADEGSYLSKKNDGFKVVPLNFTTLDIGVVTSKGSPYTTLIAESFTKNADKMRDLKVKWLEHAR
ncbi:amino acid ABC transporter substrate-binding protein [Alphaproteobacteria bacterium]|nr:amino acid ABC transporter substrate-binding protein [Alphaproteobacteria bacterium]GHS99914.1 amino acid ABC transporter substrate-binding protein [Alphaproteobacteria bacterium]